MPLPSMTGSLQKQTQAQRKRASNMSVSQSKRLLNASWGHKLMYGAVFLAQESKRGVDRVSGFDGRHDKATTPGSGCVKISAGYWLGRKFNLVLICALVCG